MNTSAALYQKIAVKLDSYDLLHSSDLKKRFRHYF